MTAFQRRPATIVVPVSTAVQTFLPIVLEPFFLIEHWGSAAGDGVPVAAGLAIALRRRAPARGLPGGQRPDRGGRLS